MAALHDALKTLSPATVDALPSPEDLPGYMANALRDTHILVNSLPTPSNIPCEVPSDPSFESLQKEWKPVKLGAKENPLGFNVYRLAAKDGKGTWFARRSIHEEVGFRRFRAGLAREFECGAERGNSIRGVGREKQVEKSRCRLGQAEVNYLTAQFPGPSAPRDFVTTTLTSSAHPQDLFPSENVPSSPPDRPKPRQFTMISRPLTDHPECAERQGYVRGQFESIEFIREIPSIYNPPINRRSTQTDEELRRVKSVPSVPSLQDDREGDSGGEIEGESERAGRRRGRTITFADNDAAPEGLEVSEESTHPHPKQNPVEWIMITRSDPGGSVPRWMVERGTPGGIVKDAEKFLDWAAGKTDLEDGYPEDEGDEEMAEGSKVGRAEQLQAQEVNDTPKQEPAHGPQGVPENRQPVSGTPQDTGEQNHGGLLSSAVSAVSAGVSMITPSVMSSSSTTSEKGTPTASMVAHDELLTPPATTPGATTPDTEIEIDDSASMNSFATAPSPENDTTSVNSASTSAVPISTPEEKALARLLREKAKLAEKLERQRSRERKKRSKEDEKEQKLLEKHMKEVEKREARYNKDIEKARRREEKRKAKELSKEQKEVIELKKVVEGLTKENLALREKVELLEGRERLRSAEEAVGAN